MSRVFYSVWEDTIIDNREKRFFEIEEIPELNKFEVFEPGNPIHAFIGGKGFYVFNPEVNILEAMIGYITRAARESCGKCTPCRVGLMILKEKMEALRTRPAAGSDQGSHPRPQNAEAFPADTDAAIDDIYSLAYQISSTSLCGLGQTATVPLLRYLENFRDEFTKSLYQGTDPEAVNAVTYVTAPCIEACPQKVEIPKYIDYIKEGKFAHSLGVVLEKYPMAATCGRVCVRFCEMACKRTQVDDPVGIKVLKRFVADRQKTFAESWFTPDLIKDKKPADLKVAVIGTGPAGISAAYHLLLRGYPVEVFEGHSDPGGMAGVGIPEYRLPKKDVLQKEVSIIESLGGKITYGQRLGRDFTLDELHGRGFKAVFLGLGAHKGKGMRVPGEDRSVGGYITGVKFLLYINHYYIDMDLPIDLGEKMVVVGGGNVAMDCVRSALRLGVKEVHLVYRRTKKEMPADPEEIEAAEEEGVVFHYMTNPTRVITEDNRVTGIELVKMNLGEPDASGRRGVSPEQGSEHVLETDFVIPAIGQAVDHSFLNNDPNPVEMDKWGCIAVSGRTMMTSRKGIFAGGDCVTGPATLIEAMNQGEKAAEAMDDYLTYGRVKFKPRRRMSELIAQVDKLSKEPVNIPVKPQYKVEIQELDPAERKKIFNEVEKPITVEEAYTEAMRCMRCYRVYSVITEK